MLEKYDDVLSVEELSEAIKLGRNRTYDLLNMNAIEHIRVDNKYIVPKECVIKFLRTYTSYNTH